MTLALLGSSFFYTALPASKILSAIKAIPDTFIHN